MTDITLSNLISLILTELATTFEQTISPVDLFKSQTSHLDLAVPEELLTLHVSDLDIDLPAHLQVKRDPSSSNQSNRLVVSLPSPLESSLMTRRGRIRITIQSVKNSSVGGNCER